jgi:hypothetical protein
LPTRLLQANRVRVAKGNDLDILAQGKTGQVILQRNAAATDNGKI